jgi:hypothetical protein
MSEQWVDSGSVLLRDIIGDSIEPYTYSNSRVKSLLASAAYLNVQNIDFTYSYTVNRIQETVSPEPNDEFISLMVLRAVVMIAESEWKTISAKGMSIKDGPTSIDMSDGLEAKKEYAAKVKENFDKAVIDYKAGNYNVGEAIVGAARFDLITNYGQRFY